MTSTKQPRKRSTAGAGRKLARAALVALTLLTVSTPAWAYLDPSTGSMIISAIVGLFATVGLAVKTYWYKIKAFFRREAQPAEQAADPVLDSPLDAAEPGVEAQRSTEH